VTAAQEEEEERPGPTTAGDSWARLSRRRAAVAAAAEEEERRRQWEGRGSSDLCRKDTNAEIWSKRGWLEEEREEKEERCFQTS